jgi:hypothetical protein
MQNVPNTLKFCVFIENRLWRFVEALKSVENDTEIPVHTPAHFFSEFREGHFRVFDFQLRIEVKFRKRRFSTFFGKIFTFFAFYRLDGPIFTWGENLNFAFFSKSAEHVFGFGSDFVLLYSRKSVRTKMTTPTDYPIGPLLRRFSLRFCSDSRL